MTIIEAMKERHSVRSYKPVAIPRDLTERLQNEIDDCNHEGGLHIQLVTGEPKAFDGLMAHYGKFSGVTNYIALIGKKSADLDERVGYYGERLVLLAQSLGLNTCWVAMTFSKGTTKKHCTIEKGEKLVVVLALGYGATQGVPHQSKSPADVTNETDGMPEWFKSGIEAALLAPTAMNQQKFRFTRNGTTVKAESLGGFYSSVDLGIVKYHFELGAGKDNFRFESV